MNKKRIAIIALAAVILVGVVGFIGLSHIGERCTLSEGNIVFSKTGDAIFIGENGPFVMSDGSKKGELFAGFADGDGVRIIHGYMLLSYPGRSEAYFAMKSSNPIGDKAEEQIKALKELGWLEDNA